MTGPASGLRLDRLKLPRSIERDRERQIKREQRRLKREQRRLNRRATGHAAPQLQ